MAERKSGENAAVTPRQLLVVGVLGVVLVMVLISQFGGATSAPGDASTGAGPNGPPRLAGQAPERRVPAGPLAQAAEPKTAVPGWPKFTAETASQYDPFVVPQAMAEKITASARAADNRKSSKSPPKRDASAEKMAALKSKGITLIVRGERGAAALLGNRVVRVGDVVEGYRVESIDLQGVVLAPANRPEAQKVHP